MIKKILVPLILSFGLGTGAAFAVEAPATENAPSTETVNRLDGNDE